MSLWWLRGGRWRSGKFGNRGKWRRGLDWGLTEEGGCRTEGRRDGEGMVIGILPGK